VRGILGTEEQLFGVTFRKNNFGGRDKILTVDAFASTIDYDAYDARTLSLVGTYERVSTLLFQKPFSYSAGLELVATREREIDASGNLGPPETFFIVAVPAMRRSTPRRPARSDARLRSRPKGLARGLAHRRRR
jgi:translocation and assembly module TamA